MSTTKKISVGVVMVTHIPEMDGKVAILQVRGECNPENKGPKGWRESFPGACQVSAHGRIQSFPGTEADQFSENDWMNGLLQEVTEELGATAAAYLETNKNLLMVVSKADTDTEISRTYAVLVPAGLIEEFCYGPASGGIRLLPDSAMDSILDLKGFDKKTGVTDRTITAMFPDEIEAVNRAFAVLADPFGTDGYEKSSLVPEDTARAPVHT